MKKLFLVLASILVAAVGYGQGGPTVTYELQWLPARVDPSTGKEQLNLRDGVWDNNLTGAPVLELRLPAPYNNLQVTNALWSSLSADDRQLVHEPYLGNTLQTLLSTTQVQGQSQTRVTLNTVRMGTRGPERLESVTYQLRTGQASATQTATNTQFATNSVLATKRWFKFSTTGSGVFKLDFASLRAAGVPVDGVNPNSIKVYGNGNQMLPEPNATPRVDDLNECPVWVSGDQDGVFNPGDYLVFYTSGVHTVSIDSAAKRLSHRNHIYADNAYVFVTIDNASPGKRLTNAPSATGASQTLNRYDELLWHEQDKVNLLLSGREFFGEVFSTSSGQNINFSLDGAQSAPAEMRINLAVAAKVGRENQANLGTTRFNLSINGAALGTVNMPAPDNSTYGSIGRMLTQTAQITSLPNAPDLTVRVDYDQASYRYIIGYLNWIELQFKRQLRLYNGRVEFTALDAPAAAVTAYEVGQTTPATQVWDVSTPTSPTGITGQWNNGTFTFAAESNRLRRFVAFDPAAVPAPKFEGEVANQNLHGMTPPTMVIVTHPSLLPAANEYATYRQGRGIDVAVVTTDQIYNEFGGGAQDIVAIRDFCRMLYSRGGGFKYLMLLGESTYDPRYRANTPTPTIPSWESAESFAILSSYCSDDFYGFLDPSEGRWNLSDRPGLDIGIGRVPARNLNEARAIFNKFRTYENNPSSVGRWRNQVSFVADNGDNHIHLGDAEQPANLIDNSYKNYISNKVYLADYTVEYTPQGEVSPSASNDVFKALQEGSMAVIYSGHGSEAVWTDERILTLDRIERLRNMDNLPLVVTATCEFGRYDDPGNQSGGELFIQKDNGGAVAVVTTGRKVVNSNNTMITTNLTRNMFATNQNGAKPTLGDAMLATKNASFVDNLDGNRGFALLGDPSMTLNLPRHRVLLTHLNDTLMQVGVTPNIKALQQVRLRGEVQTQNSQLLSNFNGRITVTVYDKPVDRRVFYRNPTTGDVFPKSYKQINANVIYNGTATVRNGLWNVSFIVPKDIDYREGSARIMFYAADSAGLVDANGFSDAVRLGGSQEDVMPDDDAPVARLYMNDTTFVNGGITSPNPVFLARLSDLSGINLSASGIGHEISAVLDGKVNEPIILNNFYTADDNNFQSGWVRYPFYNLTEGLHTITLTAWDTHNNSTTSTVSFTVVDQQVLSIRQVMAYPNPISSRGSIMFEHNFEGQDLKVAIDLFDLAGRQIKRIATEIPQAATRVGANGELSFDARNDQGQLLPEGMYLYTLEVKTAQGQTARQVNKLLIRRP